MAIRPDTDELIAFLNSLLDLDREAMSDLIVFRTCCNAAMGDHPSVQVGRRTDPALSRRPHVIGLLGVLNGYCGVIEGGPNAGWGPITAVLAPGPSREVERFERTAEA